MEKKYIEHLCILSILLAIYAVISQFVYQMSGLYIHRALVWNVFLALLPLVFIYLFLYAQMRRKRAISIGCLLIWLLLFPNVPYLISDFIHITPLPFYELSDQGMTTYIREILPWMELMHIAVGVLFGILVGYHSLFCLQNWVRKKYNIWSSWCVVIVVCILSGYGVFLGRFLRLNSWDVLDPIVVCTYILNNIDMFTFLFTSICSSFILITYILYYTCCKKKIS